MVILRNSVTSALAVILAAGCAVAPIGPAQSWSGDTSKGTPIWVTSFNVGTLVPITPLQVAEGGVWAVSGTLSFTKTVRVDAKSDQVSEITRPFNTLDLLVADKSLWFSDSGSLHRTHMQTNQNIATIAGAGSPFAYGDDTVWAYDRGSRVVSGIDSQTNLVSRRLLMQWRGPAPAMFLEYGAGSIWQVDCEEECSSLQLARGLAPRRVVRRIDPRMNSVVAEIPIGPYRLVGVHFVAGNIWITGDRGKGQWGTATRIDVNTNQIVGTLTLRGITSGFTPMQTPPLSPAAANDGIWIATTVARNDRPYFPGGLLLKIDPNSYEIVDQIFGPEFSHLASGDGALWVGVRNAWVERIGF